MTFTNGNKVQWLDDLKADIESVEKKVDKACKSAIGERSTFEVNELVLDFSMEESTVILKANIVIFDYDSSSHKILDTCKNQVFDYYWNTEMISIDELSVALFTLCEHYSLDM